MPRWSRRTFVGWMGALGTLIGARRLRADTAPREDAKPATLPLATLTAVAAAVLP